MSVDKVAKQFARRVTGGVRGQNLTMQEDAFESAKAAVLPYLQHIRDEALAESRAPEMEKALRANLEALERARAAIWDGHYGKGLSVGYAQAATKRIKEAQTATRKALGEEVSGE